MPRPRVNDTNFSEAYKIACRDAWYAAGRPLAGNKIRAVIPHDGAGNYPNPRTLITWKNDMKWDWWADSLDSKAIQIREDQLIQQKVDMLARQAEMAKSLQAQGMEYLKREDFDTSASAVSAIIKGAELERVSRGLGETIERISKMNDDELKEEILKRISRAAESGQMTIDVTAEEIPTDDNSEKEEDSDTE